MNGKKAYQLTATANLDPAWLMTVHSPDGSGPSKKITIEDFLSGLVKNTVTVGLENADYIIDPAAADVAIQAAIDYCETRGGGVVHVKGGGSQHYTASTMTIKDTVSMFFDKDCYIVGKTGAAPNLFISEDFASAAGSGDAWAGIKHGFFVGGQFEGGNQTASGAGATAYRSMNAVLKFYAWDYHIGGFRINYCPEIGLYTEHDSDWNSDGPYNAYEFGENTYIDIKIKGYGKVGWVNRGSHDSVSDKIYLSSSDVDGLDPDYGYIQQTDDSTGNKFGAHGHVAHYLHIWGQHNYSAVLLDASNIISGFIYAEGCDAAGIYLRNTSGNRFNAFVGYCTNGVELAGTSSGNEIECVVESNVTGALFYLNDGVSNNILRQGAGYGIPGGGVFQLASSYTGTKNTFELWVGNTATEMTNIAKMADNDVLVGAHKNHLQYSPNDVNYSGTTILATAGESLVFGDVVYVKSDGKMGKADADAIATAGAVFIALGTIANNAKGLFLVHGVIRGDSLYNLTTGGIIYLSTTAGGITQTAPTGAADVVQILGVALTADKWLFNPNLGMVELVS